LPYLHQMSDRSRLHFVFFNSHFSLFLLSSSFFFYTRISVCEVEILLFVSVHWRNNQHQPHMFLQTPSHSVDHYCYSFLCYSKEKRKDDKTTDNDLSLLKLSSSERCSDDFKWISRKFSFCTSSTKTKKNVNKNRKKNARVSEIEPKIVE